MGVCLRNFITLSPTAVLSNVNPPPVMKHPAAIPTLCAIFGFLLAWFMKPNGPTADNPLNAPAYVSGGRPASTSLDRSRDGKNGAAFDPATHTEEGVPLPPELIAARAVLADTARNSLAIKDQGYVQRIAELLGLNVDQQQQMLLLYQQKRDALNLYGPGKDIDPRRMLEEAEAVEKRFNDSLAAILSSEQIAKLNGFRQLQSHNRALATAQKEYADVLEKIDLNVEQQSTVLAALQQQTTTEQSGFLDKTGLYAETFDAMGFGSAGEAMSMVAVANAAISESSDRASTLRALVQSRKEETSRKIESLRPLLTPAQLAQYSSLLEARDQAFYSAMAPMMTAPPPSDLNE